MQIYMYCCLSYLSVSLKEVKPQVIADHVYGRMTDPPLSHVGISAPFTYLNTVVIVIYQTASLLNSWSEHVQIQMYCCFSHLSVSLKEVKPQIIADHVYGMMNDPPLSFVEISA